MGFRRRTRRRAVIAGAAVAHHESKKHAEAQQAQAPAGYEDEAQEARHRSKRPPCGPG